MNASVVPCSNCREPIPWNLFNLPDFADCPHCGSKIYGLAFPALLRQPAISLAGETLMIEGEASCFYHLQKKAIVACSYCGRFLCALCEVELNGQKLCPRCIEEGRNKGRLKSLENRRTRYDNVALALTIIPLLIFYITILTAPIALYISIRHWNTPLSVVPRSKFRFIIAIFFAITEIVGCLLFFYFVFNLRRFLHAGR